MEENRGSVGTFTEVSVPVKRSNAFQSPLWPNYLVLCKEKQVTPCSLCFLSLEMMLLPTTSIPPVGRKPLGFLKVSFETAGVLGVS